MEAIENFKQNKNIGEIAYEHSNVSHSHLDLFLLSSLQWQLVFGQKQNLILELMFEACKKFLSGVPKLYLLI